MKGVFDWAGYDTLEKMRGASTEAVFTLADRFTAETGTPFRLSARPVVDGEALDLEYRARHTPS